MAQASPCCSPRWRTKLAVEQNGNFVNLHPAREAARLYAFVALAMSPK
jgi:hypothetical protein